MKSEFTAVGAALRGWVPVLTGAMLCFTGTACRRSEMIPSGPAGAPGSKMITFNQHIQPILSENCYHCHGPDASSRKGGLRLDRAEFALKGGESGRPAIVPGEEAKSLLVQRILSKDPQEVMPPPTAHHQLDPHEIGLITEWIKQGAAYEEHWAFIAPSRPPEPVGRKKDWPRNGLDRFILSRLENEGLAPAPEADGPELIRRVTYDLTGLPPTPEETAAFMADTAPGAYERVVDRLLASPRYGEHRARYWLDAARYGDSHGLHSDYELGAWPYRDYVIRAYNENKPFDQFIRENLAGDLLPARNLDQQLASAFIRLGISSGEAGAIVQELRVNNQRERVETFGSVFLALTTGCAACHDHKFDPISQRDHYQLAAFFNHSTEYPNNQDRADWPPFIRLPAAAERDRYDALLADRAAVQLELRRRREESSQLLADWLESQENRPKPVSVEGLEARLKFDEQEGRSFANLAPGSAHPAVEATGAAPVWGEETWLWPAMRLETSTRIALPEAGDVEADEAFSVGAWIQPNYQIARFSKPPREGVMMSRLGIKPGGGASGWEIAFLGGPGGAAGSNGGRIRFRLQGDGGAAVVETERELLISGRWNHVLATYDGRGRASGLSVYVDGVRQAVCIISDDLQGSIRTTAPMLLARRDPDEAPLRETAFQDFRLYRRELDEAEASRTVREDYVSEVVARRQSEWNEDERQAVEDFYFSRRDGATAALIAKKVAIDARLETLTKDGPTALVSEEAPGLAYAHVLSRGSYAKRLERVRPAVPHFLPPLPPGAPSDRRGLAEWTVSAKNPLTARVIVNRMWAELFGTGIVETVEDFGVVGARPSHPELLDWLAVEFRESAWDVKRFYRLLVTSSTYRQSARVEPVLLEKDPDNRLLARGPRFRMDGEMLRDTLLFTSGLLVEKEGGPSVKPYQPPGIWEAGTPTHSTTAKYEQQHGEALYRRSLYTFWKRMGVMPNMSALDVPDRDVSCVRRQRTINPLQALVTLNDVQWLEAARKLGERLVRERTTDAGRLDLLGHLMLARPWREQERSVLVSLLEKFRATYTADPSAAALLLTVGEAPGDPALPAAEVAAWMLLASTASNLDATLNK